MLAPGKQQTARGSRAAAPTSTCSGSADAERAGLAGRMVLVALPAAAQVGAHAVEALRLLPAEANPSLALVHVCNGESVPSVKSGLALKGLSQGKKIKIK